MTAFLAFLALTVIALLRQLFSAYKNDSSFNDGFSEENSFVGDKFLTH